MEHLFLLALRARVDDAERHLRVQERQLAQPFGKRFELEHPVLEDLPVGQERDLRARSVPFSALPVDLHRRHGIAALVLLVPDLSVAVDLHLEPFAQRVHDRHADAVQTARDLVRVLVELAAGMEHGHDDFEGRALLLLVHVGRNAAAVVDDGDRAVLVDRHVDVLRVTRRAPRRWSCPRPRTRGGAARAC